MSHIRCAIYTRKSSEEGLEQSFNSLHAQREACEAYIRSQKHEGWQVIPTHYDHGGFSGGNMERPALKHLMADIEAGKVNTVVVYKVDRLTRSLADFAKIIEKLDSKQVSFVSVTQQFNTTTSMGRLTLNVLLSFAQFEREVTGERIRDKIAASKKKGMWMGGHPPLGYNVRDRKLHIVEAEADTVRTIFAEFLRLGNVNLLRDWMRENNVRSKEGNFSSRGSVYQMLRNPIYAGLIRHNENTYPGQHKAILERETWDKTQALLTENRQGTRRKARATKVSLFTGMLFDAAGNLYTPTHANKNGRRYRYYTSQAVIRKREESDLPTRIPVHDLEAAVVGRILQLLLAPAELLGLKSDFAKPGERAQLIARAAAFATSWKSCSTAEQEQFVKAILDRVIIHPAYVEIRVNIGSFIRHFAVRSTRRGAVAPVSSTEKPQIISFEVAFRHVSNGQAVRLVVGGDQSAPKSSKLAMLKAIARARLWYEQLVSGKAESLQEIGRLHNVSIQYVKHIFRLAFLSPGSVESIVYSKFRSDLTLGHLINIARVEWNRQRVLDAE
jgi:DNA invertase Pin-like site-specific DNA recombinase